MPKHTKPIKPKRWAFPSALHPVRGLQTNLPYNEFCRGCGKPVIRYLSYGKVLYRLKGVGAHWERTQKTHHDQESCLGQKKLQHESEWLLSNEKPPNNP